MAKALPGQTLPSREQGQFRSIVKFYETKQYKKDFKKKINISDMITHKLPLKKWVTGFDYVKNRKAIKAMVKERNRFSCWND